MNMPVFQTVSQQLLQNNRLCADALAQSLARIGTHHVDYADIYCQRTAYESWHLDDGIVKSGNFHIDQGVGAVSYTHLTLPTTPYV